jgi:hypothetical protein
MVANGWLHNVRLQARFNRMTGFDCSVRTIGTCAVPARSNRMPSSVIRAFAYDSDRHSLAVEFISGRRYRYDDVPQPIVEAMRAARSKGQFFNTHIRDRFATTEIG